MIRRSTLVMLVIFVALLAVVLYLRRAKPPGSAEATTTPSAPPIFTFAVTQIKGLKIQDDQNGVVQLERADATTWKLVQPAQPADSAQIDSAVNQLTALEPTATLDPAPDAEATGLARPAYTLTVSLDDNSSQLLFVGKMTPIGGAYYVQQPRGKVMTVSQYSLEALIGMVKTPPIQATPTPEAAPTTAITGTLPTTGTLEISGTLPISNTVSTTSTLPLVETPTVMPELTPTGTITATVTPTTTKSP